MRAGVSGEGRALAVDAVTGALLVQVGGTAATSSTALGHWLRRQTVVGGRTGTPAACRTAHAVVLWLPSGAAAVHTRWPAWRAPCRTASSVRPWDVARTGMAP
ncbi:MAG: hypothetical protein ACLTMP_14415 [Eggerthella lenta]